MELHGLENIGKVEFALGKDISPEKEKRLDEAENLPELLAKNKTSSVSKTKPQEAKENTVLNSITKTLTVLNVLSLGFFLFTLTPLGKKTIIKTLSSVFRKKGLKRLKQVRANMPNFKEVPFVRSTSQEELKQMAKSLGIKIKFDTTPKVSDIAKYNEILEVFSKIHNKSKGRIKLPKVLKIKNAKAKDDWVGLASYNGTITFDRNNYDLSTIYHEIGHINHYERAKTELYYPEKLLKNVKASKSQVVRFYKNKKQKHEIAQNISHYASTSPIEFVAETFAKLMQGEPVPANLKQLYARLNGIPRVPVIQNNATINEQHISWDLLLKSGILDLLKDKSVIIPLGI